VHTLAEKKKINVNEAVAMENVNLQEPNDFSESVLISQRIIPYLQNLGYKYLDTNTPVSVGNSRVYADVVVYLDKNKAEPYIAVEAKGNFRMK
jgi:hypothetical protein